MPGTTEMEAARETLLTIRNLAVSYGKIRAIKNISLDVREGELVAVIGSNGAGKTTLLKTVSGLLRGEAGDILFEGRPITNRRPHQIVAAGIAHIPEGRKIFASLTVRDNLLLGGFLRVRNHDKRGLLEDIDRMYSLFPRLKEREDQHAGTLSGGEQQMLAIARALVSRPKLLLLDEPSMGLAPVIIDEVFRFIEGLKKEKSTTILLVEQLAYRALEVADRAYVIERGEIRLSGTAATLMNNEEVKKAYLGGTEV